uniref:Putative tick transposon n=1 Tax=Rhipicephalus microplus TaxID=6941 RepID=A0A6M2D1X0_RHIMP
MAATGKFEPFFEDRDEDFESYIEWFEHFLRATQVSDDLKVLVLVTAIEKKTYCTLKNLLAPAKPEEKEYAQLIQALKKHYAPEPMVIAERFQFNRRIQQDTEPVAGFALELMSLAASCDFVAFLDEALWDRFVAGLKDETTQAELLKRATLTFAEACELAQSIELACSETKKF